MRSLVVKTREGKWKVLTRSKEFVVAGSCVVKIVRGDRIVYSWILRLDKTTNRWDAGDGKSYFEWKIK